MECTFNQEGFCIATEEFDGWVCPLKDKTGHCTAKPEQLDYCCPYCGESDCEGDCCNCDNAEDRTIIPKSQTKNRSSNDSQRKEEK
jgi:hypothetical protein